MADRLPPCDFEAERAVVSACLLAPDAFAVTRDTLQPNQFFEQRCRLVYEAAIRVDDSGSKVDAVTLACALRDSGRLEQAGGVVSLAELLDASPDLTHIEEHCAIVADKARLRRVIEVCRMHAVTAYGDVGSVDEYCDTVEREILGATDPGTRVDAPQTMRELILQEMPAITARQSPGGNTRQMHVGTKTGIFELDAKLWGGMDPNLYVVGARPGMGKTAFAGTLALAVARTGRASVFFSCEMPKEQLAMRFLAAESLVPYRSIRSETLYPEQWNAVLAAADRLSRYPLSIQYKAGVHVSQVRSTFRREFSRLKRTHGAEPGLGVVDYAQLLRGDRPKGASRDEEVGSISRYCMGLPSEFKCPVLLLSQLNRELERRPDKRPQLSDLRESGSLEQDGYGIFFLYRDEQYHPETLDKGEAEIIIAKNRNGETGTVKARFDGPCTRFCSINQDVHDTCDDLDDAIGADN